MFAPVLVRGEGDGVAKLRRRLNLRRTSGARFAKVVLETQQLRDGGGRKCANLQGMQDLPFVLRSEV